MPGGLLGALWRTPELLLLIALAALTFGSIAAFGHLDPQAGLSVQTVVLILLGSFLMSVAIAIFAVVAGIGGGIIFTPLLLGFTNIDTLVVRATGLVVAMFSGLISAGPLLRRGIADLRLVFYCGLPITVGALAGAAAAAALARYFGASGDAVVRLLLGLILLGVAWLFVRGGARHDYPQAHPPGAIASALHLHGSYYEQTLLRQVPFTVRRPIAGALLFLVVGFVGGFFGLGGGWAILPVLNLVMAVPVKMAAGSSGLLLALGDAAAIWTYIGVGALLPLFAAPWMVGQVVGGILGARVLARVRVTIIRKLLIGVLLITSGKLLWRACATLGGF